MDTITDRELRGLLSILNCFHDKLHGLHPEVDLSHLQDTRLAELADSFEELVGYAIYENNPNWQKNVAKNSTITARDPHPKNPDPNPDISINLNS